jgi:hypothetical protein
MITFIDIEKPVDKTCHIFVVFLMIKIIGGPCYLKTFNLQISLFTLAKNGPKLQLSGLKLTFICQYQIFGPKLRNCCKQQGELVLPSVVHYKNISVKWVFERGLIL